VKLAPRKPDWDLKRDVAKKLEKLERRTQRAIAQLIRTLAVCCYVLPYLRNTSVVMSFKLWCCVLFCCYQASEAVGILKLFFLSSSKTCL